MVCAWRATERHLPPAQRLVDDPFARGFLGVRRGAFVDGVGRLPAFARAQVLRRIDTATGGAMSFVLARHRAIDEALLAADAPQVVLLGAGYDSREARLEPALRGKRLLQVDHPATAARRAELASAAFGGARRAPVTTVLVDFTRDSLEERLLAAGLDPALRTFWVWEGVSMYLDEAAVRGTFDLVRRRSAPGSRLAFDAWCPQDRGPLSRLALRTLPSLAFRLGFGEPLTWGPARDRLGALLGEHGLALRALEDARSLIARLVPGRRPPLGFPSSMVLVQAEVRGDGRARESAVA